MNLISLDDFSRLKITSLKTLELWKNVKSSLWVCVTASCRSRVHSTQFFSLFLFLVEQHCNSLDIATPTQQPQILASQLQKILNLALWGRCNFEFERHLHSRKKPFFACKLLLLFAFSNMKYLMSHAHVCTVSLILTTHFPSAKFSWICFSHWVTSWRGFGEHVNSV